MCGYDTPVSCPSYRGLHYIDSTHIRERLSYIVQGLRDYDIVGLQEVSACSYGYSKGHSPGPPSSGCLPSVGILSLVIALICSLALPTLTIPSIGFLHHQLLSPCW